MVTRKIRIEETSNFECIYDVIQIGHISKLELFFPYKRMDSSESGTAALSEQPSVTKNYFSSLDEGFNVPG